MRYGFTKSELERVKKDFLSELDEAVNKAPTRNSRHLARRIMWSLNADRVFMSPVQDRVFFSPLIKSLTLKSVHDAFKGVWAPGHRLILVTGNTDLTGKDKDPEPHRGSEHCRYIGTDVKKRQQIEQEPQSFQYRAIFC